MTPIHNLKTVLIAAGLLAATSGLAHAGDCKNVKLSFENESSDTLRVKSVVIDGNDGTWTEDINNVQVDPGETHLTDARRMNKLDSGAKPDSMFVEFDRLINGQWVQDSKEDRSLRTCADDMTYFLKLN